MDRDCALPFGVRVRANGSDRGLRKCNTRVSVIAELLLSLAMLVELSVSL